MIRHHLDDATLVSFAAGALSPAMAVVVSAHLEMCPSCRRRLADAEAVGGAMLEEAPAAALSDGAVNDLLEMLDVSQRKAPPAVQPAARAASFRGDDLPKCVSELIGGRLEDVAWRQVGAGVSLYRIETGDGDAGKLMLMRIEGGRTMPEHGHGANEATLVLSGAYQDELGTFRRGDVADLDSDVEHQPVVPDGPPCLCLVAIEAPTRFKGVIPRLMQPYIGL